jgi:hypothetical protein
MNFEEHEDTGRPCSQRMTDRGEYETHTKDRQQYYDTSEEVRRSVDFISVTWLMLLGRLC